jgi:hypothetical protein
MVQKQSKITCRYNLKGKIIESKETEAPVVEYKLGCRFFRVKIDLGKKTAYYELHTAPSQK